MGFISVALLFLRTTVGKTSVRRDLRPFGLWPIGVPEVKVEKGDNPVV